MSVHEGYLVVRKPEFNFDELKRGVFSEDAPRIDNTLYSGLERMQWFDFDEQYFEGSLNEEMKVARADIRSANPELDYKICADLNLCKQILSLSNRNIDRNEIIAISIDSPGEFSKNFVVLGIDVFSNGYGSLLLNGLYKKPDSFRIDRANINKNGLFEYKEDATNYRENYIQLCESLNLEVVSNDINICFIYQLN